MIDLKLIRENPDLVRRAARDKNMDPAVVDRILEVDARRRALETELNDLRSQQNKLGQEIPTFQKARARGEEEVAKTFARFAEQFAQWKKKAADDVAKALDPIHKAMAPIEEQIKKAQEAAKPMTDALAEHGELLRKQLDPLAKAIIQAVGPMKTRIKVLEDELEKIEPEQRALLLLVPQIPAYDEGVPVGRDASANVEVRRVGTPKMKSDFGFAFKDHLELGTALGIIDVDRGVKIAGSRNYVLRGAGTLLHEAVLRLAFELMVQRGFTPMTVPVLVNDRLLEGAGFFPLHRDEVYLCERDQQSLVGTAEVPVTGYHMDEILDEAELPKLYFARSTCFRREAGAAGKDTRGLYRIHYFEKVEQVVVCKADAVESRTWHDTIVKNAEDVLQALGLPYRVMEVCTGDMGQGKVRMYDIETWMPSREAYGETHSASRLHDFQARRLNLRYRRSDTGKPDFCHTLNNTVIASPRILIPILEMNQNADGAVTVPPALRPYMQGIERIG